MGALSLVGITPRKIIGKKAPARIRNTHRSVDESFDLQFIRDMVPDLTDLLQAEFSAADYSLRSEIMPEQESLIIYIVRLC